MSTLITVRRAKHHYDVISLSCSLRCTARWRGDFALIPYAFSTHTSAVSVIYA